MSQSGRVYLAVFLVQGLQHQCGDVVGQRGAAQGAAALSGHHQLRVVTHSLQLHQHLQDADEVTRLQRLLSPEEERFFTFTPCTVAVVENFTGSADRLYLSSE